MTSDTEQQAAPFWTVAIYSVGLAYGGPEEGGWWYQCGERIDHALDGIASEYLLTVWSCEAVAGSWSRTLQEKLDASVNVGKYEISSVLSNGRYYAQVYNGHPPANYPETRPHYE